MSGRDEWRDASKNDVIREVIRLRALLAEQLASGPGVGSELVVEGIVGFSDGAPQVHVRAGEAAWQWTPAQAREHALYVLAAATEAERDAALVEWVRDEVHDDEHAAAVLLDGLRRHRRAWLARIS